jgi:hypothetical protein
MVELTLLVVALIVSWTLLGHLFDIAVGVAQGGGCPTCGEQLEQLGWVGTVVLQDGKEAEGTERFRLLECPGCRATYREARDGTLTPD